MKFTRVYMIGRDHKATEEDYVVAYVAENGAWIKRSFAGNSANNCWYSYDGECYDTLKEAKAAVIRQSEQPASEADAEESADVEQATPETSKNNVFETGKSYRNTFTGNVITITKRTAQFIFYTLTTSVYGGHYTAPVARAKICVNVNGEHITAAKNVFFAANEVADEQAAPETATPDAPQEAANDEPEADTTNSAQKPAPEFNYDYLSGRYAIFEYADGVFSNEYETDDLKEARERIKEEWEGSLESGAFAIFDRDARQYIWIRATSKGRKAFKAENERLAAKAVSQTESDSAAAGQPAPQEGMSMTDEEKMDALFHELVPVEGKADTVAGEIVRAVCRIGYRYNNDGDYVGSGYGKETCNPAARYLIANAGEDVAEIVRCLWAAGEECGVLDDGSYDDWLSELVKATLAYLDERPELKTTPNVEDYWNYRDPVEDVDKWDEDENDDGWDEDVA